MSELVSISIDGIQIQVPKGLNLIETAKLVGVEIPHYCYHPDLSIAGNCRMCQVELKGSPKLVIACNTFVGEGMEVFTHRTSEKVRETQQANLEFILKNHPLDCTVCDQSGHCKLQDYYFEYSRRESRLLETKVKKKKAFSIGKHVMLDAERCILCTRCVRFLDEITKTSELGVINRGDRSEIDLYPGKRLDNPLSATVIDLCPVGALTYSDWRFNTRIWFTEPTDTICVGCSRNCSVRVHQRDGKVVTVKARYNKEVNKEWLCDEGRFGFNRFIPIMRVGMDSTSSNSIENFRKAVIQGLEISIILSSFLTVEDITAFKSLANEFKNVRLIGLKIERNLDDVQKVLIKPDYSPNFETFNIVGIPLIKVRVDQQFPDLPDCRLGCAGLTIFEHQFFPEEIRFDFIFSPYVEFKSRTHNFIPTRSVYEKTGHFINSDRVMQKLNPLFTSTRKSEADLIFETFTTLRPIELNSNFRDNLGRSGL